MSWPRGAAAALPLRAAAAAGELILDARVGVCVFVFGVCAAGRKGGGTGSDREPERGRSCPLPGDLPEPPPHREPRPPPASRTSGRLGWRFPRGQEGVWTGAPREGPDGRAAPLILCVLSVFLSQGPVSLCAAAGGTIRA